MSKYYLVVIIKKMVMITKPNKRSYRDMWMLMILLGMQKHI
jgi:hypothetical protein